MKLYVCADSKYEYALWAASKQQAFAILGIPPGTKWDLLSNQTTNKNLRPLIADKGSIYRNNLHQENGEWIVWRVK